MKEGSQDRSLLAAAKCPNRPANRVSRGEILDLGDERRAGREKKNMEKICAGQKGVRVRASGDTHLKGCKELQEEDGTGCGSGEKAPGTC